MLATIGRFVMAGALAGTIALWPEPTLAQDPGVQTQATSGDDVAADEALESLLATQGTLVMLQRELQREVDVATQASVSVGPSTGVRTTTPRLWLGGAPTGVGIGDSSAPIQSRICRFDRGPRQGQTQNLTLLLPVGTPCGDGTSTGHIVAP